MTVRFTVGETYTCLSTRNPGTVHSFTVVSRTAQRVALKGNDGSRDAARNRVYVLGDVEACKPYGSYSRCIILRADGTALQGAWNDSQPRSAAIFK